MSSLALIPEEDSIGALAVPPLPMRYHSFDEVPAFPKPPMPMRRHSVHQTEHEKVLTEDVPEYLDKLKSIHDLFDDRPDSPPPFAPEGAAADTKLGKQTLDTLFGQSSAAKHPLSYELHEPHQLEMMHDHAVRSSKLAKTSMQHSGHIEPIGGAEQWIATLDERRVVVAPRNGAEAGSSSDRPPIGWVPSLATARAVLKLRSLMAKRASRMSEHEQGAATAGDSATDPVVPCSEAAPSSPASVISLSPSSSLVSSDALHVLSDPDFDVNAFVEECWIAQAATDPARNDHILQGAYDEPPALSLGMGNVPHYSSVQHYAPPPPQRHIFGGAEASAATLHAPPPSGYFGAASPTYTPQGPPYPAWQQHPAAVSAPHAPNESFAAWGGGEGWASASSMAAPPMPPAVPLMAAAPLPVARPAVLPMAMGVPMAAVTAPAMPVGLPCGRLYALAQEQDGSRTLQQHLAAMPPAELAAAVDELAPHLGALATHPFGNYLVSSMAFLPLAQPAIHTALRGRLCALMQHPQGSRVCQAAFERLPQPAAASLVAELRGRVCEVACGTHGSWSVVACYRFTRAAFIAPELAADIARLATDQNGSRVVQRVLMDAIESGEDVSGPLGALLALGSEGLTRLALDRFGNYVVQIGLRHAPPQLAAQLHAMLVPTFRQLSTGKCGSNVAEVLVDLASPPQLSAIRTALGRDGALEALRGHAYGVYVMASLDKRLPLAAA